MFNPQSVKSDRRVKLLITKFKRNKITPSHNHATLLLHNNARSRRIYKKGPEISANIAKIAKVTGIFVAS